MQDLTIYVVAFCAGLGALIGGGHLAILFGTIACGLVAVLSLLGAFALAKQKAEAQAQLDELLAEGGSEWLGVPPDPQSGIRPAADAQSGASNVGFDETT